MLSVALFASAEVEGHLLWDYTEKAPQANPDNGLYYASKVDDAAGTNLGLKGIKLNSTGYCYFTKTAVAGTLKLTYSDRKGNTESALDVFTYASTPSAETLIATTQKVTELQTVNVELTAEQNNIYIQRNTPNEQVLTKIEFCPTVSRTFQDFEMILGGLPAEFDVTTLPEGVTFEGQYNNDNHGYRNAVITVPVDGTVKFTYSSCSYGNVLFNVTNSEGTKVGVDLPLTLGQNTCYHQNPAENVLTFLYVGEPTTLVFGPIQYLAYFKAEATEVNPCKVTYKDQNGVVLGTRDAFEGDPLGEVPYTVADINVPEGQAFRGWVYPSNNVKVKATDVLTGNTTVQALVTPIETTYVGKICTYDLSQKSFYPEDHELINITDGAYYNEHGWTLAAGATIDLTVAGNAHVVLKECEYGNGTTIAVTDAEGNAVAEVPAKVAKDATSVNFQYTGAATTLRLTFAAQTFLHGITVYNVEEFPVKEGQRYNIPAGSGSALVLAINSLADGDTIYLPNGLYDFGELALTCVSANNVVIMGESMEETIIRNAPDTKTEGIGTTATILNTGSGNKYENLTIQNALDYYKVSTGRAVTIQDKGTKTVCYRVRLLSYQDTYYSNLPGQQCYFEECEIHGTVDFICGSGSVYFYNCLLYAEKRNSTGGGSDVLTANSSQAARGDKGYVFDRCTVQSECPTVSLGRAWNDQPMCAYLLTTIDYSAGNFSLTGSGIQRWTTEGMNVLPEYFAEYRTMDVDGKVISPNENNVNFTYKGTNKQMNTIIGYEEAVALTYPNFFNGWNPAINYQAFPENPDTAVETVTVGQKACKRIVNGQLVIERDGRQFNALGQIL